MGKTKRAIPTHGRNSNESEDKHAKRLEKYQKSEKKRGKAGHSGSHHYVSEQEFELYLLRMHGLQIHLMRGDGNCLFRSLAHQLQRDPDTHHVAVRQRVVRYMEQKKDFYSLFLEDDVDWDEYIDGMRCPGTWGGYQELCAAAQVFNLAIHVFQWNEPKYVIQPFEEEGSTVVGDEDDGGKRRERRIIMLSFHDQCHYNSLRPADASLLAKAGIDATSLPRSTKTPSSSSSKPPSSAVEIEVRIDRIMKAVSWVTSRDEILLALDWAAFDEADAIDLLCSNLHQIRLAAAAKDVAESTKDDNSSSSQTHSSNGSSSNTADNNTNDKEADEAVEPSMISTAESSVAASSGADKRNSKSGTVNKQERPLSKKEQRQKERQEKVNALRRPHLSAAIVAAKTKDGTKVASTRSASVVDGRNDEDNDDDRIIDAMREIVV